MVSGGEYDGRAAVPNGPSPCCRSGFTLIEVMVTMAIFAGTLAAFTGFYVTTSRLNESSRNLTQAMNDGQVVLEAMRNTAQSGGLIGGIGVTGVYPAATNIVLAGVAWALQNETVKPSYSNPGADPLPVTVQVSWAEWGRTRTVSVDTMITRR